eukprot:699508-Pyramimonas_sp.AAC.1
MASRRNHRSDYTFGADSLVFWAAEAPPTHLGASPHHAMSCCASMFGTKLCHVMLCHAATSDCANRQEIYAM